MNALHSSGDAAALGHGRTSDLFELSGLLKMLNYSEEPMGASKANSGSNFPRPRTAQYSTLHHDDASAT